MQLCCTGRPYLSLSNTKNISWIPSLPSASLIPPPSRHTKKFWDINDAIPISLHFVDNILQFSDLWALIHWPPDSSKLFRCNGAITVFIKQRGSFHDFRSAFFSQLLAMVWARLRNTDRWGAAQGRNSALLVFSAMLPVWWVCSVSVATIATTWLHDFCLWLSPRSDQAS